MKRHLSLVDMRNASDDTWTNVDNRKAKRTKNKTKDKTAISAYQPAELIDASSIQSLEILEILLILSTNAVHLHKQKTLIS